MSYTEDFARLEAIIEKLLSTVDELRRQKAEMEILLQQKEEALRTAQSESGSLHEERDVILARVNKLIGTIEEWEGGAARPASADTMENEEQSVFSIQEQ